MGKSQKTFQPLPLGYGWLFPVVFPQSGSDVRLTWTAVSNTAYRLEFKPDLIATNWNALPGDVIGVSNTATKLDMLTPSNRFYRVRS